MGMKRILEAVVAVLLSLTFAAAALGQAAQTYTDGQKIEVREGDVWSKATVVKREGRRYLIHYDGADAASDEWVTADRLRLPTDAAAGANKAPATKPAAGGAAAAKPAPPAAPAWRGGDKVEVKWGGTWFASTVVNHRDGWYLIDYDGWKSREWVEPWRIRKPGSNEDDVGHARPNPTVRRGEGPPKARPDPAPEALGGRRPARPDAGPAAAGGGAGDKASDLTGDPAYKAADTSGERVIDLKAAVVNARGGYAPEAPPAAREVKITLKGMTSGPFDQVRRIIFPRGKDDLAFAAHGDPTGGVRSTQTTLEQLRLAGGTSTAVHELGTHVEALDVSPDGTRALAHSVGFGGGTSNHLIVFDLAARGGPAKRAVVFTPYGGERGGGDHVDIRHAFFVGNDRALTFNRDRATLWDLAAAKSIWSCPSGYFVRPALSAGGKYVAVGVGWNVFVLEAATGEVVFNLESSGAAAGMLAFSPSGKRLVANYGSAVAMWDLAAGGQLLCEYSLKGLTGRDLLMPAEEFAFVDGQFLLHVEKQVILWNYFRRGAGTPAAGPVATAPSGQLAYINKAQLGATTFVLTRVPHADAVATAGLIRPEQSALLRPGVRVGLAVNVNEDPAGVAEALKARIAAAGFVYDEAAPLKFVATVEPGKSEEREYRPFGAGPFAPPEKVTVTTQVCRLVLQADGETAWESSTASGAGLFLRLKEGQTIQDAVNEASKPNLAFFKHARLPKYVPKPLKNVLGTSYLTANGVSATER